MLRWLFSGLFGSRRYLLVLGSSFATADDAVQEAQNRVDVLARQGWEAISVGVGGRAASGGTAVMLEGGGRGPAGGGNAIDVVVLMRR